MKYLLLSACAFCLLFTFSSCKKNQETHELHGLSDFTVTVIKRIPEQGIISWSVPMNIYNSDTIKYKVFLEDKIIDSNLVKTLYTLNNLSGDTLYHGKVIAYTKNGDTVSAPFVLEKVHGYIAFNSENHFEVYNLYSGKRIWNLNWDIYMYVDGSPTIIGDTVFFSNSSLSIGNTLKAYNLKTGQPIWNTLPANGKYLSLCPGTSPVYSNGKIIVATRYGIIALRSATGEILWTYSLPNQTANGNSIPIVENGKVFVGGDGVLVAVNENDGTLVWSFTGRICKRPLPYNNSLIIGTNDGMYSLDQMTGKVLWQHPFSNVSLLVSDNVLLCFLESDGLYALSPASGATIWKKSLDWLLGIGLTIGNKMCFYTDNGNIKTIALKSSTGEVVWDVPVLPSSNLIFAKNQLIAASGHNITLFNALDGQIIKNIPLKYLDHDIGPYTVQLNDTTYYSIGHGNYR